MFTQVGSHYNFATAWCSFDKQRPALQTSQLIDWRSNGFNDLIFLWLAAAIPPTYAPTAINCIGVTVLNFPLNFEIKYMLLTNTLRLWYLWFPLIDCRCWYICCYFCISQIINRNTMEPISCLSTFITSRMCLQMLPRAWL